MMNKLRFWLVGLFTLAAFLCYGEEEYYVGVATTKTLGERYNPATTWYYGIGWSPAAGYDANQAAEQACNERANVKCWPRMSSMQGGCIVLVEGTWTDRGMEPVSELFSRTSTLGVPIAERAALHICEAVIHSGKPQGTVTSWECTPRVTFCSSHVAAQTQPTPSASSLDSAELADDYYVGVATTKTLGERYNPATTWYYGIGWSPAAGYDANEAAEQACNERANVKCWPRMNSMQGGCIVLVEGTWTDRGMEPVSELFSRTSTLGVPIAERAALHICEAVIHSGKPQGTVTSWECTPRVTFCSSHVAAQTQPTPSISSLDSIEPSESTGEEPDDTQQTQPTPSVSSLDSTEPSESIGEEPVDSQQTQPTPSVSSLDSAEPSESTGEEPDDTRWKGIIRVPIVAYPDSGAFYWDTDGWGEEGILPDYSEEATRLFGCFKVYHSVPYGKGSLHLNVHNYCDEPLIFIACVIKNDNPVCYPMYGKFSHVPLFGKYNGGYTERIKPDRGSEILLAVASYSEQAREQSFSYDGDGRIQYSDMPKSQVEEINRFTEALAKDLEAELSSSR